MDTSPLAMQFDQFDSDKDGRINSNQAHELMKLLGKNIYLGSVQQAILLINYENPNSEGFTLDQFQEYHNSNQSEFKQQIWKAKYELLKSIHEMREKLNEQGQGGATAAPGSKAHGPQEPNQGDIQITIGPSNHNHESFIEFNLTKESKGESKPYVKIVFEQASVERAKDLETKINNLYQKVLNILKEKQPQSAQVLESFKLITNVIDCRLNVFITNNSEDLIELGMIFSQYLDKLLGVKSDLKLFFKHSFSADIEKFLDKNSDYTFYHATTQNTHTKICWNAFNFKQSAKQLLKINEAFSELKYDPVEPFCLLLVGLLHMELCQVALTFDNAQFASSELESKMEVLNMLGELQSEMDGAEEELSLNLKELYEVIDNKIQIELSLGDWKSQTRIEIKNLTQILLKKINNDDN